MSGELNNHQHQIRKNPNGKGWGWVDEKGDVWVWTPDMHGGPGWTVQQPDGGHYHAYPGGKIRNHFEIAPQENILDTYPAQSPNDYLMNGPISDGAGAVGIIVGIVMIIFGYDYSSSIGR